MVKVLSFRFQHRLILFTFCLLKGPLKPEFLDIYLNTDFGVRNFQNASAMTVIFCRKYSTFNLHAKDAERNSKKILLAFRHLHLNWLP